MTAVQVTALLRETAALGRPSRADYRQHTYDHVPGSVLRGALAAAWLRTPGAPGPDDPAFRQVFEGDGTFGPLHSAQSLPVPLSVWTHKGEPGSRCPLWWDEVGDTVPDACPSCDGPVAQSKGTPVGRPELQSRTRVAIDKEGIAVSGRLFRREALAAGTELSGWVSGPAVGALSPAGRPVTALRLGGERSIRGRAELTTADAAPPTLEQNGGTVVLRLASPGVFVDDRGLPADRPAAVELGDLLGVEVRDVVAGGPRGRWVRRTEVGGWHMASGLPKPRDRAVAPGSTYRVVCDVPPSPERLAALAVRGVGLRRREGCGGLYVPSVPVAGPTAPALDPPAPCRAPAVPTSEAAAPAVPLSAVAAVTGWARWPRLHPHLRRGATIPESVLRDPTLSPSQRDALATLIAVTDPAALQRLLDALEVPR